MTALQLGPVDEAEFHAQTSLDDDTTIRVNLTGNADMRVRDVLDAMLVKLHAEALRVGAATVIVDLQKLEFMNSSCFKSFVSWISNVQELEPAKKYQIRLISKSELLWQRRSLHALRCFAVDLVTIEAPAS